VALGEKISSIKKAEGAAESLTMISEAESNKK
jgi:hypothetical protein